MTKAFPEAVAAIACPAYLCWSQGCGYFIRFRDAGPYYDREGNEIGPERLMWGDQHCYKVVDELGMQTDLKWCLDWLDSHYRPCGYWLIHLADDEWGSRLMEQVAMEHFESDPTCEFVMVYEHAGWSLGFRRDGSLWSSANGDAKCPSFPRPSTSTYGYERRGTDIKVDYREGGDVE